MIFFIEIRFMNIIMVINKIGINIKNLINEIYFFY